MELSSPSTQLVADPAPKAETGPVLTFSGVTLAFDGPPVLKDITFSVAPNETRILLGPTGVGKSVLLKLANGLLSPDAGSIFFLAKTYRA